jgi:GT2 family glycosyltransferase
MYTVGLNTEIVVVDDASADGSAEYVAESFPWVRLLRNKTSTGLAACTNRGVSHAGGRYGVVLNAGTEVTSGWLDALLLPLQDGGAGLTTPRVLRMGPPGEVMASGNPVHYSGLTGRRGLGRAAGSPDLLRPAELPAVSGTCFALSKELWQQLGGLDSTFLAGLAETDLSLRARLAGYKCAHVPEAVVYRNFASGVKNTRRLYLMERNRLLMLLKVYGRKTLLQLVPALAVAEAVTWKYAIRGGRKHVSAKLRAYRWLLAHREEVARMRRETRRGRRQSDTGMLKMMAGRLYAARPAELEAGRKPVSSSMPLAGLLALLRRD